MRSLIFPKFPATLLIAIWFLLFTNSINATESVIDKRLDQLIDGCVNLINGESVKTSYGADTCEKVSNTIKARTEMYQKAIDAQRLVQERERWESFGWPGLILFDALLIALIGSILWVTKDRLSTLLNDPDGKVSFSRVIGLFGASSIFIVSALLVNVLLAHLYIFNAVPEDIVSLFAPILTFMPTLLPYVFAKREEGSVARELARASRSR